MRKTKKIQCVAVKIDRANREAFDLFTTIYQSKEAWQNTVRISQCPHCEGYYIDAELGYHPFGPDGKNQKKNRELLSFAYPKQLSVNQC